MKILSEKKEDTHDYKNKAEALLFASGKKLDEDYIRNIIDAPNKEIMLDSLNELRKDYDKNNRSLMIINNGENWKITVREKYIDLVRKIVSDTELSKSVMETLAIVAWKSPVLQSDVIKIRTNKAYDHIGNLLESGFVTKEKHGRSFILKVTEKFYNYFDVEDAEGIRDVFAKIKETPAQKKVDEFEQKEMNVSSQDKSKRLGKLEIINTKKDTSIEESETLMEKEKIGKLEVYEKGKDDEIDNQNKNNNNNNDNNDEDEQQEENIEKNVNNYNKDDVDEQQENNIEKTENEDNEEE